MIILLPRTNIYLILHILFLDKIEAQEASDRMKHKLRPDRVRSFIFSITTADMSVAWNSL